MKLKFCISNSDFAFPVGAWPNVALASPVVVIPGNITVSLGVATKPFTPEYSVSAPKADHITDQMNTAVPTVVLTLP